MNISKKASSNCFKQSNASRRKLYSKGQSDEDNNEFFSLSQQDEERTLLQQDEETPVNIPHEKNAARKTLNFSLKSQSSGKVANSENFPTIDNTINNWSNNENRKCFEKNSSTIVSLRKGDEEIFKKPIHPPLKSTTKKKGRPISEERAKLKNSLRRSRVNIRRISFDSSSSSSRNNSPVSGHSTDNSTRLKQFKRIKNNTSDKSISKYIVSKSTLSQIS